MENVLLDAEPTIEIANEQSACRIDEALIRRAVLEILAGEGVERAQISVAVVDDRTIQAIHRKYLNHDDPTDVISFPLEWKDGCLDGEIVVSAETALAAAQELGWPAENELLLYVVHGTLHLLGYDDQSQPDRREMRDRERRYLTRFGMVPPWKPED